MEEVKQDVMVDSSPIEEGQTDVNENVEGSSTETNENEAVTDGTIPEFGQGKQSDYSAVDEYGVPWQNRAREYDRKFNELTEALPNLIQKAISENSKPQQQEYTVSQLEAYAIENPEYRPWVEEQKEIIRQKQLAKLVEERLSGEKQKSQAELKKQQAYGWVVQNNPDLFKVENGRKVWDVNSPIVQTIGQLMNDPRFANDPEGIIAATDIAYGRHLRQANAKQSQKVQMISSELKKEQRKNMVEAGSNAAVQSKTPVQVAMDNLRNQRSKTAGAAAIKEILKAQGVI